MIITLSVVLVLAILCNKFIHATDTTERILQDATRALQPSTSPICVFHTNLTSTEAQSMNCGFRCADPWDHEIPHHCGAPYACCCAPSCDYERSKREAFIGINWSDHYKKRGIPRTHQFQILKDSGLKHIKTFSPSGLEDIYRVYGEDVRVYVGIPNRDLVRLAVDLDYARKIVREQLLPYQSIIEVVIVANEPLICIRTENWAADRECGTLNAPDKLVPALRIVHRALQLEGMPRRVTTALNGGVIEMSRNPWTPCIADYRESVKPMVMQLAEFLRETGSPFIVNLYSWFACMNGAITPRKATGVPDDRLDVDGQYEYYFNFDMQLDMNRVAMCKNGIGDLELWIGETGWPTAGHPRATLTNAYWFATNVIRRAQGKHLNDEAKDRIRNRDLAYPLFFFEAFDEEKKYEIEHGNIFENSFGLFCESGHPKWRDQNGMIDLDIPGKKTTFGIPPPSTEYDGRNNI